MTTQSKPRNIRKAVVPRKRKLRPGSPEAVLSCFGRWHGSLEELERLEREIQSDRDREVRDM